MNFRSVGIWLLGSYLGQGERHFLNIMASFGKDKHIETLKNYTHESNKITSLIVKNDTSIIRSFEYSIERSGKLPLLPPSPQISVNFHEN